MSTTTDTTLEEAINQAYETAVETFEPRRQFPIGWVKLQGLDGRTKEIKSLKEDDRFNVRSATGYANGPQGTTVTIDRISCQGIPPKEDAYRAFLEEMQEHGFLTDARLYTRWD